MSFIKYTVFLLLKYLLFSKYVAVTEIIDFCVLILYSITLFSSLVNAKTLLKII
jgi:hypothetical protein